jgi:hypothetical protein
LLAPQTPPRSFVIEGTVLGGARAGEAIDTERFRVANLLTGTARTEAIDSYGFTRSKEGIATHVAANLRHNGGFHVAEIPASDDAIEGVTFQVEEFQIPVGEEVKKLFDQRLHLNPELRTILDQYGHLLPAQDVEDTKYTAAHGMIRITFKDDSPVILRPQDGGKAGEPTAIHEIVLSVHAVGTPEDEYDPIKGLANAYASAWCLFSLQEKVDAVVGDLRNHVRQYGLDLPADAAAAFLRRYLERATEQGLEVPYNTVRRNCGSELFTVLDEILHHGSADREAMNQPLARLGQYYPKYAENALHARGVLPLKTGLACDEWGGVRDADIAPGFARKTLNEEFPS